MADRPPDDRRRGGPPRGGRPGGGRPGGPGGPRGGSGSRGGGPGGPAGPGGGYRRFDGPRRDGPHDGPRDGPRPDGPRPFDPRRDGPRDWQRPGPRRDRPPGPWRPSGPRPSRDDRRGPDYRQAPGPRPRPWDDRGGYDRSGQDRGGAREAFEPRPPYGPRSDRPRDPRSYGDRPRPGPGYGPRPGPGYGSGPRPFGRPPFDRGRGGPPRAVALPPPEDLGPDEELIAGRRPVEEAFVARRPAIRLLVVPQRRGALEKLVLHATNLRIPIVEVEGGSLTALAGFDGHQGVALVVEPRRFASLDDVLARAAERGEPPFILVLDSLEDPHNVGTLLRSAEAAGVHGVLFPTHRQAPLSPSAVKASAGAIEHLLLCPVDDLPGALSDLHARGVRVAGAEGDAPMTARQSDLRGPLAIVVGSEGQGLGPTVRRRCDLFMRIPMKGVVGSLNAAVAGSILLFEALAQRDPGATPTSPATDAAAPKPAPKRRSRKTAPAAVDEAADVVATDAPASAAPRKARARKAATTSPDAPATDAPASPGPRKARARKAATPRPDAEEDDLLPADGTTDAPPEQL